MGAKRKNAGPIGSQNVRNFQAMISSSDSYGSEGGLKEKPVVLKKRGGKKRNKAGELVSTFTGFTEQEGASDDAGVDNQQGDSELPNMINLEIEAEINQKQDGPDSVQNQHEQIINQNPEILEFKDTPQYEETKMREASPTYQEQVRKPMGTKTGYKPIKKLKYSPPMIKEYDPNEDNARTRAKKRADTIKKKDETWEIDEKLWPEHPTPWKGKPADFFLMHEPRRGTSKVLNNSQKEFIMAYYPENVSNEVTFMEHLYRLAKDHEDKERWAKEQNERDAAIVRGRTANKKGKKRKPVPQYVQQIAHVNKEVRGYTKDHKPMSFESLLEGDHQRQDVPDYHSLAQVRREMDLIQANSQQNYQQAYNLERQHHQDSQSNVGFCAHCHNHGMEITSLARMPISSGTANSEIEIQRQNILMQICEAKKRQARMEAEEARRLRDEARRLAEQASILELEAQRPLLEAQKLEQEARVLEAQMARIPHHTGMGGGHTPNPVAAQMETLFHQHRSQVDLRKNQLMEEARHTQNEIKRLQVQAMSLQTQALNPTPAVNPQRSAISQDMRQLQSALEKNNKAMFVASENSIAAQKARAEKEGRSVAAPRERVTLAPDPDFAAQIPAAKKQREVSYTQVEPAQPARGARGVSVKSVKKKTDPAYEEHNYEYGEETDDNPTDDPYMKAADKEFKAAQRAFDIAQKSKADAQKKQDDRIKKQQDDIEKAQEQTQKYFDEEKKRKEEEKSLKKPQDLKQNQAIASFTSKVDSLLQSYNSYINRIGKEKSALVHRYSNRGMVQEFLEPLLSGKIFREFDETQGYINFSQYLLDDNFRNGHQEYFHKWRHLFLYESYSFLMNSRWSKFTGNDIQLKNVMMKQSSEKSMCWKGYLQYFETEGKLATLKMFKEPPNVYSYSLKNKNYSKIYDEKDRNEGANFELNHCREDDIIVISKFRINLEGQEDIKMVAGGVKFLREVISKPGVIFGYVRRANSKSDNYVELQIDGKQSKQFQVQDEEGSGCNIFTRYFYFFESVLTSLREFRALKAIEFTRMAPILTYPTLALDYKDQMNKQYLNVVNTAFGQLDSGPEMQPKEIELKEDLQQSQMNNYLIKNHHKFNKSQAKVLEQIIEMPKDDIMLIQGPPGTGKTHTIIGIISMIMGTRLATSHQKIMVCAPSNAAIDQIITRIIDKGLIGLKDLKEQEREEARKNGDSDDSEDYELPDLTQQLVRITGAEYQADSHIKKHTLDQRIIKKLCIEKFGDLKKCIKDLNVMIGSMNNYDDWDDNEDFPYVSKAKFAAYQKTLKNSYLKTVQNWGNHKLSRPQQLAAMQDQLKMHNSELNEFKSGNNIQQGNLEWKEAEKAIIEESCIVACTLSMAGSAKLDTFRDRFEYLIIDEACQSTEPSTMIPFAHCPKRVILVGDQKQLPATTFSGNSEQTGYCKSLFERLLDAGFDKTMLTIQFRMHPKIRAFPSEQFYGGAITDHPSIGIRNPPQQIINLAQVFSNRIIFFDLHDSEEVYDNKSKCNYEEADFTRILIDFIARKSSLQGTLKYIQGKIGVISPYKAQVRQLYSRLEKLCSDQGCNIHDTLEVNTVDAFQGSEKDIIIFNCVRSNFETMMEKSLGFLLDERRLNVAITRPKYFLMVVGNSKTLKKSDIWENMINYCRVQGKYINVPGKHMYESMGDFKKHVMTQFNE